MARDADDQPGNLWDYAELAKLRGEALTASGAIERHPSSLIDARIGAQRAREALGILRSHEPYKGTGRRSQRHTAATERQEAAG